MKQVKRRKASKPREWYVVLRKDEMICAYYFPNRKDMAVSDLKHERQTRLDPFGLYKGAKVIKVREVMPKKRGK